jgi:hypothetical protein
LIPQRKRKSKYYAKKVEYDGIKFDSKLEGARYKILKAMQDQGDICELEVQVPYECVVEGKMVCKYIADFRYRCGDDVMVEDTKGVITQVFSLKKKLVEALYPGLIIQIIKDPRELPRTAFYPHPLPESS